VNPNPDRYIYVYILRCADGSYYVGITRGSLEIRVSQDEGLSSYPTTNNRLILSKRARPKDASRPCHIMPARIMVCQDH
jgi:hypothetical protein